MATDSKLNRSIFVCFPIFRVLRVPMPLNAVEA